MLFDDPQKGEYKYMNNKFTVIKSVDLKNDAEKTCIHKIVSISNAWERQYLGAINKVNIKENKTIQDLSQYELAKIGLSGVKYLCSLRNVNRENKRLGTGYKESLEESRIKFQVIDYIFTVIGCITLSNFVTTFPITKEYDGAKWETKDYFYTMDVLSKMDWDKPIGRDNMFDFLWDYVNDDLRNVCVEYMNAMSAVYRSQTGKGMMEQFCEDNGIGTYTVDENTGIMRDNQTGEISKFKNQGHIQVVK